MSSNPPLPPGWQTAIDPGSGRLYYANTITGESSWQMPLPPPPPPPLPPIRPPPQLPPPSTGSNQSFFRPQIHQQQTQQQTISRLEEREQRFIPPQHQQSTTTTITTNQPPGASSIRALASAGSLVAAGRGVVDARTVAPDSNKRIELHGLTSGQLVDLLQLQNEQLLTNRDDADATTIEPYLPVNPYNLPEGAKCTPMEAARLDIRLHSLYDKLKKIKQ